MSGRAGLTGAGTHGTPPEKDARGRRLYPFTEQLPAQPQATTNLMAFSGTMTTYKPDPFHGIDRWLFATDEWQHRMFGRLPVRPEFIQVGWYVAWRPFCDWWGRRMGEDR